MKRLTLLAVALTMVMGMAATSFAAPEVTISGNVLVNAVWRDNWDFADGNAGAVNSEDQALRIQERADLYFTVTANENLKGVLGFRSVRGTWGQAGMSSDNSGSGAANTIDLRDAYLDFNWPGTSVNVKAGLMPVGLPAAVGGASMIQNARTTGVMVSSPITDNVSVLGGWTRLFDSNGVTAGNPSDENGSQIDAWILALPLNFEGIALSPFFVYAPLGTNAVTSVTDYGLSGLTTLTATAYARNSVKDAWWLGTDFNMSMFDPFVLKADINYGVVNGRDEEFDRSGWLFDIALDYTGFDFMNLSLTYAYTTGEDDDRENGSERMPILVEDWAIGSFWFGGGLITGDDLDEDEEGLGFHAVALSATGIQSFVEGLTHDAHIVYAKGTNDKDSVGMIYGTDLTEEDAMWELDFNTMYKIYDELTLYNGIGYVNLDYDKDVWAANADGGDAWKFQLGMVYQF